MCNRELLGKHEFVVLAREVQILIQGEEKHDDLESELLTWQKKET